MDEEGIKICFPHLFLLVEQDELAVCQDAVLPLPDAGLGVGRLAAGEAVRGRTLHVCAQGTQETCQRAEARGSVPEKAWRVVAPPQPPGETAAQHGTLQLKHAKPGGTGSNKFREGLA